MKPLANILGNGYCNEHCKGQAPMDEKWVFGKNGNDSTFANVLVYVAKGLEGKKFAPPSTPSVLDQVGFILAPRVNAAGRMSSPDIPARLLLSSDVAMAAGAGALQAHGVELVGGHWGWSSGWGLSPMCDITARPARRNRVG